MPERMTPAQFAARIREKHPGEYDDISDADLTSRVVAKFPDYRDMVRLATPTLDRQGIDGAEVKRRAAAGEPIVQSGLRPPTTGDNIKALGAAALAGAGEGLGGTIGIAGDIGTTPVRALRAGLQARREGAGYGETTKRMKDAALSLPITRTAVAAADDLEKTARGAMGLDEGVATTSAAPAVRFGVDLAMPGPTVGTIGKGARKLNAKNVIAFYESKIAATADDATKAALEAEMRRTVSSMAPDAPTAAVGVAAPPKGSGAAGTTAAAEEKDLGKYAEPSAINLNQMNIPDEAKMTISRAAQEAGPELEAAKGRPMSSGERLEAARQASILKQATTREQTLKLDAELLRLRQHIAAMSKDGKVTPEFIQLIKTLSEEATARGRALQSLSIKADPELYSAQVQIVQKLTDLGLNTDTIVKEADGVNFNNVKEATAFYRKFVKPSIGEIIDEFRYINLLSSPKTHLVNAFSNMLQASVMRPAVRLTSGLVDNIGSRLTGKEQEFYLRQVPAYYRGMLSSFGDATKGAIAALRGTGEITQRDLRHLGTGSKLLEPFQIIPRALQASDTFFTKIIEGAEMEALAKRSEIKGQVLNEALNAREAAATAAETVFRKPLDAANESGHGALLAKIDTATGWIQQGRHLPLGLKWFIPFVETPMNILKQGIEFSPAGVLTLRGSTRQTEQVAKAIIGSTVFAGAGMLAMDGRTTWAPPRNAKDRAAFYDAGLQPYSVKIGDKWMSYPKLGPLAYPIAMAAAMRYYSTDDPQSAGREDTDTAVAIMMGLARFFSDQSYMQGIGDIVEGVQGEGWAKAASGIPSQMVPLVSLQRWITQFTDPVYRKSSTKVNVDGVVQNLKRSIPILSTTVPPQLTPAGEPSRRQMPLLNAVSPVGITQEDPKKLEYLKGRNEAARSRALGRAEIKKAEQ